MFNVSALLLDNALSQSSVASSDTLQVWWALDGIITNVLLILTVK